MIADLVMEQISEREQISRAQDGDREAFTWLVIQYHESVINVVFRMCGQAEVAEDAAQTAFIRAWQKLPAYQPQAAASFRSWLFRIAINAALDILRREKPTLNIEEVDLHQPAHLERTVEQRQQQQQIQRAVQALPPASRAVLVLREYERMSYQEIADTLDIPLGTVMSRLNYARKSLLDSLKRNDGGIYEPTF